MPACPKIPTPTPPKAIAARRPIFSRLCRQPEVGSVFEAEAWGGAAGDLPGESKRGCGTGTIRNQDWEIQMIRAADPSPCDGLSACVGVFTVQPPL